MQSVMPHAARRPWSWLIFDVGRISMPSLKWKLLGYGLPCVAVIAVALFHNPNKSGDARPLLWTVPLSFLLSGIVLWRAFVKLPQSYRFPSFLAGAFAFLAAILSTVFL